MPALVAVLVAVAMLLPAAGTAGPIHADATIAEYFRLQWHTTFGARGAEVAGYVDNVGNVPVDRMQLLVERLDADGAVLGASRTWVMGVIAPHQRTHFTARVAPAPSYRVSILTFDLTNCRD